MRQKFILFVIFLLSISIFVILFIFQEVDDNGLTSWRRVFVHVNGVKVFSILIVGIILAWTVSRVSLPERYLLAFLFFSSFLTAAIFWSTSEIIVDASRYFTQAKHLKMYGISYFLQEWGRGINAWTDMPLVPFLYGLIFKFFGESRVYIQLFNTLLFSMAVTLTYFIGKMLWDRSVGFYAGMLMLGIPYIFSQIPLMLVDVPTMFFLTLAVFAFINALKQGGSWVLISSIAIFLVFYSKYSTWLMLSVVIVIFLVYIFQHKILNTEHQAPNYFYRGFIVTLVSALLIGIVFWYKFDVFSEQLRLLLSYQKPGLKRWEEGFISTFFFQVHPFITIAALYSVYAAFKKRDIKYVIIIYLVFIVVLLQIKRIRYIIMVFPMLTLMASYGLQFIRDNEIKKFIVLTAVISSLIIASFAYLPFLQKISTVNLKKAGEFINSLNVENVEVFTLASKEPAARLPSINPAVSVPIFDIFSDKKIIYHYDIKSSPTEESIKISPLRFTWEYRNPEYYAQHHMDRNSMALEKNIALLIISDDLNQPLSDDIKQRLVRYKNFKVFNTTEEVFQYKTFVRVFYD